MSDTRDPEFLKEFQNRFMDRLLDLAADRMNVPKIEVVRRYHNDAKFHAQVFMLAMIAAEVLRNMDVQETPDDEFKRNQELFMKEAGDLLGWDDPDEKS